jgi:hypothetical protein
MCIGVAFVTNNPIPKMGADRGIAFASVQRVDFNLLQFQDSRKEVKYHAGQAQSCSVADKTAPP